MKDLFRYGIDEPLITWTLLILGVILLVFHPYYLWILGILFLLIGIASVLHTWHKYQIVDNVIHHYDLRTAQKILDVGTGRGFFMTHITRAAGYVAFVTGIEDQNHDCIKAARKNARKEKVNNRVNVIHGDVRHLPFPPAAFNLVTSLGDRHNVLHQLDGYEAVCNDILRVLKQNGEFILVSHQQEIDRVAHYLRQQDYVKVHASAPSKWSRIKWGTLTAEKMV